MTRPQFAPRTHRARDILHAVGRAYPGAWQAADHLRRLRGAELPSWPDWCYLPLHGAYAVVSGGGANRVPLERAHHVGIVGALAAWRMGQGIYRYDPAVYDAVRETPLAGDIPTDVLYRLPEWCVYLETPGLVWETDAERRPIHGAWAHLDWDERDGAAAHHELRLLLDTARTPEDALDAVHGLLPIPLILGAGTVADAIERVIASGAEQARAHGLAIDPALGDAERIARILWPLVSLVLYLCSEAAEIGAGERRPGNPQPVRTRRDGWRLFPVDSLTTWDVGVRLGAALRRAYQAEQTGQERPHGAPRAHVRRAHWHGYWSGPRAPERAEERRYALRWLPPIAVGADDPDALPAVIRPVE